MTTSRLDLDVRRLTQTLIAVDRRERSGPILNALRARFDVLPYLATLTTGDFVVEDAVTVERKTLPDLRRSIVDGRLFRQAAALKRTAIRPVLIVEGAGSPTDSILRGYERAALRSVSVAWYLPVLWTTTPADTVECLISLGKLVLRETRQTWAPRVRRARRIDQRPLRMLGQIGGVGSGRATALWQHFGSLGAVARATEVALADVPGVGRELARRIRAMFKIGPSQRP